MNAREHTTINKTTINIKQPPQERRRALAERQREIRPEHNAKAAAHFQSERARFRPASRTVVRPSREVQRRVIERHHFHPETYHARRAVFYETYQFHTPVWAFSLQPTFGIWDTPALAFIVAHAADEQYALWYYNHRVDPDVIAWRLEMNRLAAENAELANQLAVMDAQAQALQARGVAVDNSYVPPEMQDVALAAEVAVPAQDQTPPAQQYQQPASRNSINALQQELNNCRSNNDALQQDLNLCRGDNDAAQQRLDQLQMEINRLQQQQVQAAQPQAEDAKPVKKVKKAKKAKKQQETEQETQEPRVREESYP